MSQLTPAARMVIWGNSVLRGTTSLDDAADRIVAGDPPHRVVALPGDKAPVALAPALGRLSSLDVTGLRLVLPVAGDASGLPGPASFNEVAVAAGAAVLTLGQPHLALLSTGRSAWRVYDVRQAPVSALSVAEADRMLRQELRACTDELLRLDVAQWQPEVVTLLEDEDEDEGGVEARLPADHPPRAVLLLALAQRVSAIVTLAAATDGAAVSGGEIARRSHVFQRLCTAVRRATEAACNARSDDPGHP